MKKILLLHSTIYILNSAFAQSPLVKQWDYRFGGAGLDGFTCVKQTDDGGFIVGGYSPSGIGGDKTQPSQGANDYWIVKTDASGIKQWDKTFGGSNDDMLTSIEPTADGGYILGGYSYSGISGDKTQALRGGSFDIDYWIVKTDSAGIKEWDVDLGGTDFDYLYSIEQTADGGYILGGHSFSPVGGDKTEPGWGLYDFWIVKTDSLGILQWDKDFGGTDGDYLYSVEQTSDGGYILGGYSYSGISGDKTQACWGVADYWIVKTDSLGMMQWDKDFGGTSNDQLASIAQTTDGGYILGGKSASGIGGDKSQPTWGGIDYWIVKTDATGMKQWDKDFGGTINQDEFGSVSQTMDGGYLLAGTSYSPISGDKTESNLGQEQTWVLKTDSLGTKEWDKTLRTGGHNETGLAIETSEGCFVMGNFEEGGIIGDRTQSNQGSFDYWIIKFCDSTLCSGIPTPPLSQSHDTLFTSQQYATYQWYYYSTLIVGATNYFYVATTSGNFNIVVTDSSGCSVGAGIINVVAGSEEVTGDRWHVTVFPNPARDEIIISNLVAGCEIEVYNCLGEKIFLERGTSTGSVTETSTGSVTGTSIKLKTVNWHSGIYLVKIISEGKFVTRKIVIEK